MYAFALVCPKTKFLPEPAAGSFRKRKSCRPVDGFVKPISHICD